MFAGGFATFALLYFVQPLLPEFSRVFGVSPAESSLSVSLATGMLSVAMLAASALSESVGRKPVMVASLLSAALLTFSSAWVSGWGGLLVMRTLTGIALSGLPAVAMAYLSEEMDGRSVGLAMGLYIGGSGLGGMSGRLFSGLMVDLTSWRMAIGVIGALGLVAGVVFWRNLPPSVHFRARPLSVRHYLDSFREHLSDRGLRLLFLEGFLLLGSFVTVYNYIGYRLLAPPFGISQSLLGLVFGVYLVGIVASPWIGQAASRFGRRRMLWPMIAVSEAGALLTLSGSLWVIILGVALVTFGFFGAHSVASSWVGQLARHSRAQASSLYLFTYYMGSSLIGAGGGWFWSQGGWLAIVGLITAILLAALAVALRLYALDAPRRQEAAG
jgi:YNFM family putative membrane transporter